ncbi:hypothetical protein I316_04952 [Kwoniella heveanensis BCC8398]|uniref:Uncharacterized protein n=1 Tax=Kwoniella heveanensis BCC8398 TaxID=1296120 RepID=A0A1B9GQD0_9TREE|nr:hypothetical protein I316_04952 [Kwoniella heveanensis BCC8398]
MVVTTRSQADLNSRSKIRSDSSRQIRNSVKTTKKREKKVVSPSTVGRKPDVIEARTSTKGGPRSKSDWRTRTESVDAAKELESELEREGERKPQPDTKSHSNPDRNLDSNTNSGQNPEPDRVSLAILRTLHTLLSHLRHSDSTICPSQIPRSMHADEPGRYPDWRGMMDDVRSVVWEEVRRGRCVVTQGGEERGYEESKGGGGGKPGGGIRGPIRVKKGPKWNEGLVDGHESEENDDDDDGDGAG